MEKVHFELTLEQVNVLLTGLSKLPLEQGIDVFMYLRTQTEKQLAEAQPQDEAPKDATE